MMTPGDQSGGFHRMNLRVAFGDCDPAQIVYFPNFYRWFDQATHDLCESAGYELVHVRQALGWIGFPVVEAGARFHRPANLNDRLTIETRVREWQARRFLLEHRVVRDGERLADAWQTRFIGIRDAAGGGRLRALEIPPDFRAGVDAQMR